MHNPRSERGSIRVWILAFFLVILAGGAASVVFRSGSSSPRQPMAAPSVTVAPEPTPAERVETAAGDEPTTGLLPTGHKSSDWIAKHGALKGIGCAVCHPEKRCLDCHGTQIPHAANWRIVHGRIALEPGATCTKCHTGTKATCASCHGLPMPHPDGWIQGHRPLARDNVETCKTCHVQRDCAGCHNLTSAKTCATCHPANVKAIEATGGHKTTQCLTCHPANADVPGPGKDHRTKPKCLNCHKASDLVANQTPAAARAWISQVGEGKGNWKKRGKHSAADLTRCTWCHVVHDAGTPRYPPGVKATDKNCAASCHQAVNGSVVQRGFTNASGDPEKTTYRGTIRPGELLGNGTTAHSTQNYATKGCAGQCHQGPHGAITVCVQCHSYAWTEADTNDPKNQNLHGTHASFVGAEQSQADPGDFEAGNNNGACIYCHSGKTTGPGKNVYRASCWNCHLSAHNPITPYWEMPS